MQAAFTSRLTSCGHTCSQQLVTPRLRLLIVQELNENPACFSNFTGMAGIYREPRFMGTAPEQRLIAPLTVKSEDLVADYSPKTV